MTEDKTLERLHEIMIDILSVVDQFCRENDINYSLYAGTALGAVRHGGFIPWDDDADICMSRNDYERFKSLWKDAPIEGYTLLDAEDGDWHINHSKIIKNGTVWADKSDIDSVSEYDGIWVDIFAFDKVPNDAKLQRKVLRAAKKRLVYTRDHPYTKGGILLNLASRLMLMKTHKRKQKIKNKCYSVITKYKDKENDFIYMDLSCPGALRFRHPENILDTENIDFAGHDLLISKEYDTMLKIHYGDYMQLPPPEMRVCGHKPKIIDFGDDSVVNIEDASAMGDKEAK